MSIRNDCVKRIGIELINLISKTWRINCSGDIPKSPAVVAFWHGDMLPVWKFMSKYAPTGLVSPSKDGEILAQTLKKWNYRLVRGSSHQSPKEALRMICHEAAKGLVLITPDGPRGPRRKFKAGAVVAAKESGNPLYLCGVKILSKKVFPKSWDKFVFPLPFSSIQLEFSNPIFIEKDANRDAVNAVMSNCEQILCNISEQY